MGCEAFGNGFREVCQSGMLEFLEGKIIRLELASNAAMDPEGIVVHL